MAKFRKRPVVIDAEMWDGTSASALAVMSLLPVNAQETLLEFDSPSIIRVRTLEGVMTAELGDWVIKGVKGELYPCEPDIFAATYEIADGNPASTQSSGGNRVSEAP